MQSSNGFGKKLDVEGDSLCNLALENGHPICVRNIKGHIAPKYTVCPHSGIGNIYLEAIRMRSNLLRSCLFSATDAASRFDLATSRPFWVRGAGTGGWFKI